jgi:hypothetical protein
MPAGSLYEEVDHRRSDDVHRHVVTLTVEDSPLGGRQDGDQCLGRGMGRREALATHDHHRRDGHHRRLGGVEWPAGPQSTIMSG